MQKTNIIKQRSTSYYLRNELSKIETALLGVIFRNSYKLHGNSLEKEYNMFSYKTRKA